MAREEKYRSKGSVAPLRFISVLPWVLGGRRIALQGALALILLVALFTGSGGVALASQSALPGEQLYPVKLSLENASLALTPGRASQARLHIEYAQRRLIEIQSLVLEGSYAQIPQTVTRFEEQVNQAAQALNEVAAGQDIFQAKALATSLHETLAAQTPLMSNLYEVVPGETQPEFKRVLYVSESGMMAAQGVLTTVPSPAASPDPMAVSSTPSATEYFIVHSSTTSPLPPTTTTTPTAAPVSADTQPAPASPGASSLPESPTQTPVPNGSFPLVSTIKPSDTVTATSTPEAKKTKKPTRTPKPKRTGKPGKTPKPSHTPKPKKD